MTNRGTKLEQAQTSRDRTRDALARNLARLSATRPLPAFEVDHGQGLHAGAPSTVCTLCR